MTTGHKKTFEISFFLCEIMPDMFQGSWKGSCKFAACFVGIGTFDLMVNGF